MEATLSRPALPAGGPTYRPNLARPSTADMKVIPVQDTMAIDPFPDPHDAEVRSVSSTDGGVSWTTVLDRAAPARWSVDPVLRRFA